MELFLWTLFYLPFPDNMPKIYREGIFQPVEVFERASDASLAYAGAETVPVHYLKIDWAGEVVCLKFQKKDYCFNADLVFEGKDL